MKRASIVLLLSAFAPTPALAATYIVQPVFLCNTTKDALCGFKSQAVVDNWVAKLIETTNHHFQTADISYHPVTARFVQNDDYAAITGKTPGTIDDVLVSVPGVGPWVVPVFFTEGNYGCFNGIPSPDEKDGFHSDDAVFCGQISVDANGVPNYAQASRFGTALGHELGHYWGLKHTHTAEDPLFLLPIDRDGDDCFDIFGNFDEKHCFASVLDTPEDPAPPESKDPDFVGPVPLENHEWCEVEKFPADYGSLTPFWCEATCYRQFLGVTMEIPYAPLTENIMSYYGECRGPHDAGGEHTDPLTQDQLDIIALIQAENPERQALYDRCASAGGDSDYDGWCQDEDTCPWMPNKFNGDYDEDGWGDACDNCIEFANLDQSDIDLDNIGDLCETDLDNDGCPDGQDQHPEDAEIPADHDEDPGPQTHWEDESADSDGDLWPNCIDPDDDNDGTPDEKDPCIDSADDSLCKESPFVNESLLLDFCRRTDCRDVILQLEDPGDPLATLEFGQARIVRGAVYVRPLAARTLSQSAQALVGARSREAEKEWRSLVLASGSTGKPLLTLMDYQPGDGSVWASSLDAGRLLRLFPTERGVEVSAVWTTYQSDASQLADADGDAVPDLFDLCVDAWDEAQLDADGDAIGNACDGDFDQDGKVTEADAEYAKECVGYDLSGIEDAISCGSEEVEWKEESRSDASRGACDVADLNGDFLVDEADLEIVVRMLRRR